MQFFEFLNSYLCQNLPFLFSMALLDTLLAFLYPFFPKSARISSFDFPCLINNSSIDDIFAIATSGFVAFTVFVFLIFVVVTSVTLPELVFGKVIFLPVFRCAYSARRLSRS